VLNKMRCAATRTWPAQPLRLDGEELNLARVLVNGQGTSFKMDGNQLVLENLPEGRRLSSWKSSPPARRPRTPS
jgi:aminopeptidase N